jgi:hypothetical protein
MMRLRFAVVLAALLAYLATGLTQVRPEERASDGRRRAADIASAAEKDARTTEAEARADK